MLFDYMIDFLVTRGYKDGAEMTILDFYKKLYHANLNSKREQWLLNQK